MNESDDPGPDDLPEEAAVEALPLDAWHRARGGRMVAFAGYWLPVQYEGIIAEHRWTREQAGLFDVSHMGQLAVTSADIDQACEALEALLPADLAALKPGACRYSLLLASDGGILDDLIVTRTADGFGIVVNGATKWDDIAHLREYLPDEITLSLRDEQALLALQGPAAAAVLMALRLAPIEGSSPVETLAFMHSGVYRWQGCELAISRSGYTGEDGFEISIGARHVAALANALVALPQVKPIGLGARDSLRLEAGLPLYGHDLGPEIDPVSAGLGFAIAKARRSAGGFPGADRILAALASGTPTRRVGLLLDGGMAAREGAEIWAGEARIGHVTSGGFSPSLNRPIAMGYVETAFAAPGTSVEIETRGKRLAARIADLPFIPHRYIRAGAKP